MPVVSKYVIYLDGNYQSGQGKVDRKVLVSVPQFFELRPKGCYCLPHFNLFVLGCFQHLLVFSLLFCLFDTAARGYVKFLAQEQ